MTMTRLCLWLLLAVTCIQSSSAVKTGSRNRPYRVLSKQTKRKVRGSTKDTHPGRRLKSKNDEDPSLDEISKSGSMTMKTAYSEENLKEEKSAKKVKGSKTDKSKSKSQPSSSRSKQSVKGTKSANNIFDHENTETETVQVQCGTDVMPLLTTFVTSIQLQDPSEAGRTNKRGKRKGSKASKGNEIDVYDGEEEREDLQDLIEFPTNDLNPGEQRILEDTFRMVYNNWTMQMCDGFFRTVYTVTLTLVEKDEDEDEYSVTLENTYRGDGRDGIEFRVVNGKPPVEGGPWIRSPNSTTSSSNSSFSAPQRYYGSYDGGYSGATQDGLGAVQDGPTTFVQTVSGSDEVPI